MSEVKTHEALWQKCLGSLRHLLDEQSYKTWIEPIRPVSLSGDGELTLMVPSEYFGQYLEQHFAQEFGEVLQSHIGPQFSIYFSHGRQAESSAVVPHTNPPTVSPQALESEKKFDSFLNDKLNFDSFYESECNHVARAVAEAVAANPGKAPMNPYFIYGSSGVGKTHLCQAIGLRVRTLHPEMRVLYVSSQQFEAQYVTASRFHERTDFIHFYQQIDVLIVDDIQGLIGKTKTQQAFFEIFNHLKLLNKQIVLTSDKAPVQLSGMEDRLVSRIKGSVTVPIEKPDLALRRRILREKIAESGIQLREDVTEYIARNVQNNVRELEGTLCSLLTYALIKPNQEIDLAFAQSIIQQSISLEKPEINMERIYEVVKDEFRIEPSLIREKNRRQDVVEARQVVMYLAKEYTDQSLSAIGQMVGRRNHATVLHGCNAVKGRMEVELGFRTVIERLVERLKVGN